VLQFQENVDPTADMSLDPILCRKREPTMGSVKLASCGFNVKTETCCISWMAFCWVRFCQGIVWWTCLPIASRQWAKLKAKQFWCFTMLAQLQQTRSQTTVVCERNWSFLS